jgi:hypothetical protein
MRKGPRGPCSARPKTLLDVIDFGEQSRHAIAVGFAFGCQAQRPRGALDQQYAQAGFEPGDAAAHRRRREAQRFCRRGEAAPARDRKEGLDVADAIVHAAYC